MKEIIKSKVMVGFIVFVLGITYVDSMNVKRLEEETNHNNQELIIMNMN